MAEDTSPDMSARVSIYSVDDRPEIKVLHYGSSLMAAMELCKKPLCDDADLQCIIDMVIATICEAKKIVASDPRKLFCYKLPKNLNFFDFSVDAIGSSTSDFSRRWLQIGDFNYNNVISVIRDFIGQWQLSTDTKCVVLSNKRQHYIPMKGTIYFVDAHFSRPTPRCPNPLAVAKVRFIITVSDVLQRYYPVMITYRFEGYSTLFYALGEQTMSSYVFQRFYIDTILHTKLSFYAEICKCRHGTLENPRHNAKPKAVVNPKHASNPK
ncbi:uncharacterized protein LOC108595479 [Drosophila busckii]|uniref:uncharacterized protein LOC108595479 n=1 Tax=Drosophila busckii TaxID=30019 RepID=UPI00083F3F26|nr:uncharacterized protein LOC108595479 [Drosophila busckii]